MRKLNKIILASLFFCIWNPSLHAENKRSGWIQILKDIIEYFENKPDDQVQSQNNQHQNSSPKINTDHKKEVAYGRVRQEFRSAFDNTFAISNQTPTDQDELKKIREKSSNEVIHRLQTQFGNFSEAQAKLKAREFARSAALEFVGEKTAEIVNEEIIRIKKNPPVNPEYLKPVYKDQLVNLLKQEMLREARNRLNNEYGSLREYAGEQLRRKINPKIEKAFGIDKKPVQSMDYETKEVDYGRVRQEFRNAFNNVFATSEQIQSNQTELNKMREKASNEAIHRLQTQFGNLSEEQSKREVRKLAISAALEFVGEKTALIADEEIRRIQKIHNHHQSIDRNYLIQNIKQNILNEANNHINHYGSLREYTGEQLRRKVSTKIETVYGIDKSDQPVGGIKNIYPKGSKIAIRPIEEKECPVFAGDCKGEFIKSGKRVVLQCRHTICPECLYTLLYEYNNTICPLCREPINKDDFTAEYLQQNM